MKKLVRSKSAGLGRHQPTTEQIQAHCAWIVSRNDLDNFYWLQDGYPMHLRRCRSLMGTCSRTSPTTTQTHGDGGRRMWFFKQIVRQRDLTYLVVSWAPHEEGVGLLGVDIGDHSWLDRLVGLGKGSLASSDWSLDHGSRDSRSHCNNFWLS